MVRFILLLSLSLVLAPAHAFRADRTAELLWSTAGNVATGSLGLGGAGPTEFKPSAGGPTLGGSKGLPWPGKSQAENMAKWKSMAKPRDIAKAMMNPGSAVVTLLGGMLAKELIDLACVRVLGGTLEEGAVWDQCHIGTVNVPAVPYYYNTYVPVTSKTTDGACPWWGWKYAATANYGFQCVDDKGVPQQGGYQVWVCGVDNNGNPRQVGNRTNDIAPSCGTAQGPDGTYESADRSAIEDKLASKIDEWSQADFLYGRDPSNGGKATGLLKELVDKGVAVEVEAQPQVSGPAKSSSSSSSKTEQKTTTNPDGTTKTQTIVTTTTITNNYTYQDNRVTNNPTTKITTTVDGVPTEESEKDTEGDICQTDPTDSSCADKMPEDTDLPALPKLYEPKYPEGFKTLFQQKVDAIKATPLFQLPQLLAPNLGDSGGCPAWSLSLNVGIRNWGTFDVSVPCFVWQFLRVVTLIGALLLARALIFGG